MFDNVRDDPLLGRLVYYTVGLMAGPSPANSSAPFRPTGSGVLVEVGGVRGILTAGHVIEFLQRTNGLTGLFSYTARVPKGLQFDIAYCRCEIVDDKVAGPDAFDLGFIKLPHDIENALASSNIFYNFDARINKSHEKLISDNLDRHFIVGIPYEKSKLKFISDQSVSHEVTTDIVNCTISNYRYIEERGFDTFEVQLHHIESSSTPSTYGGMSGSGVWLIGEKNCVDSCILQGIAFRESDRDAKGGRAITCHGPRSIMKCYQTLLETFDDSSLSYIRRSNFRRG